MDLLSNSNLLSYSKINFVAPFYHTVSDDFLPHVEPLYNVVSVEAFKTHLDYLSRKFDFISPEELIQKKSTKKPRALLSFDDGLIECHSIIKHILNEKGIPAIFFINPEFVDGKDIFYRYKVALIIDNIRRMEEGDVSLDIIKDQLREKNKLKYTFEDSLLSLKYSDINIVDEIVKVLNIKIDPFDIYMNKSQVQDLKNQGHSIGGHSMSHPNFIEIDIEEQKEQITNSVDYCQKEFNEQHRLFAFPFFDFDMKRDLFDAMFGELAIDLSFGTSGLKKDVYDQSIQRLAMEDYEKDIKGSVKKDLLYYLAKKSLGRHVMKR